MPKTQHTEVRLEIASDASSRLRNWLGGRPTVTELAREANLSRQQVYRVLWGEFPPSPDLIAAAIRLGAPADLFRVRAKRERSRIRRVHLKRETAA